MDKHTDRNKSMIDQLKEISKNYTRIPGVNGYNIKNLKSDTVDNIKFINEYDMTNTSIGCTLSHLKAIKTAFDMGLDYAIICEDDIDFSTLQLHPKLEDIVKKAPEDWEILQLQICIIEGDLSRISKYFETKKHNFVPWDGFYGTGAYLINYKGMKNIVSNTIGPEGEYKIIKNPNIEKLYGFADIYLYLLAKTYTVLPVIFIVNNTNLKSIIHPGSEDVHSDFSNKILDMMYK